MDDVAVHYPDGTILCEQDKSATKGNPIADSSPELWKTMANWAEDCTLLGSGEPVRKYQMYVTPPKTGEIASLIDAATTVTDAEAILDWAKKRSSGSAGAGLKEQLARFLATPKAQQVYVICNAKVISVDIDALDPLRDRLGPGLGPPIVEICCKHIVGSAQSQARAKLRAKQPALLDADAFKRELQAFVERTNMQRLLPNAPKAVEAEVNETLAAKPTFVRQLELIDAPADASLHAVADYLQASASKTMWASAGLVMQNALDSWDEALMYKHGAIRDEIAEVHADKSAESRGRLLLAKCKQEKGKLDMHEVGHEFVHGSFHDLSDRKILGWHDEYESLLGSDK